MMKFFACHTYQVDFYQGCLFYANVVVMLLTREITQAQGQFSLIDPTKFKLYSFSVSLLSVRTVVALPNKGTTKIQDQAPLTGSTTQDQVPLAGEGTGKYPPIHTKFFSWLSFLRCGRVGATHQRNNPST